VRRIWPVLLGIVIAVGCSSGSGRSASSSRASTALASSSTSSATAHASSALTTTVTLDPAVQEAADAQGAKAVVLIYATRLQRADPQHVTQAMVDCLPDALIAAIGAHDLLVLFNGTTFDQLPTEDRTAATGAFRGCGFTDDTLTKIGLAG
jgi:hypothetical protein